MGNDSELSVHAPKKKIDCLRTTIIKFDEIIKKFKEKMPWKISINREKKLKDAEDFFKKEMEKISVIFKDLDNKYGKCCDFIVESKKFNSKKKEFGLWLAKSVWQSKDKRLQNSIKKSIVRKMITPDRKNKTANWADQYKEYFKFLSDSETLNENCQKLLKESESVANSGEQDFENSKLIELCDEIQKSINEIDKCLNSERKCNNTIIKKKINKTVFEFENDIKKIFEEITKFKEENGQKCKEIKKSLEPKGENIINFEEKFKEFMESVKNFSTRINNGNYNDLDSLENEVKSKTVLLNDISKSSQEFEELLKIKKDENKVLEDLQKIKAEAEMKLVFAKENCENLKNKIKKIEDFSKELKEIYILHAGTGIKPEWIEKDGKINFEKDKSSKSWKKDYSKNLIGNLAETSKLPSCFEVLKNDRIDGQYDYGVSGILTSFFGNGKLAGNMLIKNSKEFNCNGKYSTHFLDSILLDFIRRSYIKLDWA
ncbi:MAG: hypothetical protein LBJ32_00180 [Oscillospiraceae bacterium]|jgi:hypothetical protein|nr:hypothetical protein [Oscillospiraceae bacterium]